MACISGLFQPTRKAENLVRHSGLICVDIDRKDNLHIDNWDEIKQELCKLKEIAYISLSVSGNGYFVIIPLKYPHAHKGQFEKLKQDFARIGIIIDRACGDVTRMRCLSYDAEPYINVEAIPYDGYYKEPRPTNSYQYSGGDNVLDKVAKCCEKIEANGIDITGDYKTGLRSVVRWLHWVKAAVPSSMYAADRTQSTNTLKPTRSFPTYCVLGSVSELARSLRYARTME